MSSTDTLRTFSQELRRLPLTVAQQIATEAAPRVTELARASFERGETPYGVSWAPSPEGDRVTLNKSGSMLGQIRYVAIGTLLRVALGVRYAKYQLGKRPVFPRQDAPLPPEYIRTLQRVAVETIRRELHR